MGARTRVYKYIVVEDYNQPWSDALIYILGGLLSFVVQQTAENFWLRFDEGNEFKTARDSVQLPFWNPLSRRWYCARFSIIVQTGRVSFCVVLRSKKKAFPYLQSKTNPITKKIERYDFHRKRAYHAK